MSEENLILQVGGTLNPRKHIYIQRPEDGQLLDLLMRGQYCNVLASRQMGKSSLMARTIHGLREAGICTASIDLAGDLGKPKDPQHWYLDLLGKVERDLGVGLDVDAWWSAQSTKTLNQKLMVFFGAELPRRLDSSLVIFLDEIDSALNLSFADDLFLSIRTLNNDRALEPTYNKITFCLLGVATTDDLIRSRAATAYNIGQTLELRDFVEDRDDLSLLRQCLSENEDAGRSLLKRVLRWTGGHPYLTAKLCKEIVEAGVRDALRVDAFVEEMLSDKEKLRADVHFEQVERFFYSRVTDRAATLELYKKVFQSPEPDKGTPVYNELRLSGLVKRREDGALIVRNRIYERVFDLAWVREHKRAPEQSSFQGFFRGLGRAGRAAGVLAAVLLVLVVVLAFWNANLREEIRNLKLPQENLSLNSLRMPGATRSPDVVETILVPGGDRFFVVELEVEEEQGQGFPSYRAELWSEGGQLVWSSRNLHLNAVGTIRIGFTRSFLPAETYKVQLYGIPASGQEKLVAVYWVAIVYAGSPP